MHNGTLSAAASIVLRHEHLGLFRYFKMTLVELAYLKWCGVAYQVEGPSVLSMVPLELGVAALFHKAGLLDAFKKQLAEVNIPNKAMGAIDFFGSHDDRCNFMAWISLEDGLSGHKERLDSLYPTAAIWKEAILPGQAAEIKATKAKEVAEQTKQPFPVGKDVEVSLKLYGEAKHKAHYQWATEKLLVRDSTTLGSALVPVARGLVARVYSGRVVPDSAFRFMAVGSDVPLHLDKPFGHYSNALASNPIELEISN